MHLPGLALVVGRKKGLSRYMGVVAVFVWVVLYDKADLSLVFLQKTLDGRTGRRTVGSLEIEKLDYRNRRVHRS